ncbi:hypothetical protein J1605_006307, partial [Eschrichtius robustus]
IYIPYKSFKSSPPYSFVVDTLDKTRDGKKPVLLSKRSHCNEKLVHRNEE